MDTLTLDWLGSPVDVDESVQLLDFDIKGTELHNCSQTYTAGNKGLGL